MRSKTLAGLVLALTLAVAACAPRHVQPASADGMAMATTASAELGRAELWAGHCGRCHALRAAREYNQAQWGLIVNHMRTIADLPGSDYRRLLEYLAGVTDPSAVAVRR